MNKLIGAIFFYLLLLVSCLLSWYGLTKGHNWGGDFSAYIMQAQSIWQGKVTEFLQANRFTILESTSAIGPVAYPWGFPVLLAPLYAVFGLNMLVLKSLNIGFYAIFLILLWLGFRQYHSYFWRIILVCLFAFNPYFLQFTNSVAPDIPFLTISTFAVLLIGKVIIQRRVFISNIIDQLLLGVFIAISFFIRTQGILILGALGVTQFIEILKNTTLEQEGATRKITKASDRRLRRFFSRTSNLWFFILPHITFLIVTLLWRSFLPEGGSSHILLFNDLSLWKIKSNILHYFNIPAVFFAGVPAAKILYGASIPLAVIGMFERRDSDYQIILYGVMTILLLIVWPSPSGLRFLFPLLPFYVSFTLTGLVKCQEINQGLWKILWRVFGVSPLIVICILFLRLSMMNSYENIVNHRMEDTGPFLSTSTEVFSFISNNTATDSIIIFYKPRVMRLFTNRRSIMIDQIDKLTKGDYLCISLSKNAYHQIGNSDLASLYEKGGIHRVYENKDFLLYQIKK